MTVDASQTMGELHLSRLQTAQAQDSAPDIKELREKIPPHCFQPSLITSLQYVVRDLILLGTLFYAGSKIPQYINDSSLRFLSWTLYGFAQGLIFTGIWILGHECGHHAFSLHKKTNSVIGFFLHSILMVPFFSWKYSHARHHRYTNHMEKDTVFVPAEKAKYRTSFWTGDFLGHATDSPIICVLLLLGHQFLGWPMYMMFNAGAGPGSLIKGHRRQSRRQSHYDPGADVFTPREGPFVILSDIGLAATASVLWYCAQSMGYYNMFLLYGVPYLWMNHWLVAITFLHHNHPELPHFTGDSWSFEKGAISTVDRDFGFIGRHLFHGIIEYHVVHHMFSRIPFYHAEEATKAITPSLGKAYKQEQTSFVWDLWNTFRTCQFVEESREIAGRLYWACP